MFDSYIYIFIVLILKYGSKEESFNFKFHPHSKHSIWNGWIEICFTATDNNPCILCYFLNKEINVQQIVTYTAAKALALALFNSSDSYHVAEDVFGIKEANVTVIILTERDGEKISTILRDNLSSCVYARIAVTDHFQMGLPMMDASLGKFKEQVERYSFSKAMTSGLDRLCTWKYFVLHMFMNCFAMGSTLWYSFNGKSIQLN